MVIQEWLSRQPQAGAAGAPVLGHAGTHRVGAVAADETPVLVGDHRTEVDARHAIWAADDQGCVGQRWHRAFLHRSNGDWHAGFQMPSALISLRKPTDRWELDEYRAEPAPRCRQACRQAGRYCGNWGTGPVGFLAMRLARFREHACTGGRLRVWPRTKLIGSARSRRDLPGRKGSR